jgi:hypothetical protein
MTNPLDILFKDIRREQYEQERKRSLKLKPPTKPSETTYSNPLNWKPAKAILITHITEGPVGIFREYFHKSQPTTRRLMPAPIGTQAETEELVYGEWWLHPMRAAPLPPDSDEEIRAITQRFYELLDELETEEEFT